MGISVVEIPTLAGPGHKRAERTAMKNTQGYTLYSLLAAIVMVAIVLAAIVAPALAGSVGDRVFVTLGASTGTATWTNPYEYAAITLTRISVANDLNATNVVTAARIITDDDSNSYTQTVGAVTCVSGAGTQATLAYTGLKQNDVLSFSSLISTGGTAIVEFEVQQH